jgi:uncharacterized protein YraI
MNFRVSLLAGAMALAMMSPAAAQTGGESESDQLAGKTASTTTNLRMREGPGIKHAAFTVIPDGATLEVGECGPHWCEVSYAGRTGYAWAGYLEAEMAAPAAADVAPAASSDAEAPATDQPSATSKKWVLRTETAFKLRAGPGMEHEAIGVVPEGTVLAVEQCLPGWCEVTLRGYIEIDATAAPRQASPTQVSPAAAVTATAKGDLHLRGGAGLAHSPIGIIPAGATVQIGYCIAGRVWCEVTYGDLTGFASRRYLEVSS